MPKPQTTDPMSPALEAEKLATNIETIMEDGEVPIEIEPRFSKQTGALTGFHVSAIFPDATTKPGETVEQSAYQIADVVTLWAVRLTSAAQEIHRRYPTA